MSKKHDVELITAAYAALHEAEQAEHAFNMAVLKQCGITEKQLEKLIDLSEICDKIKIVDSPEGENQHEKRGVFKQVFVRQWSVGDSGDSFEGFIFGQLPNGKWLKVRYEC